jgi:hypothetical protein
VIAVTKPRSRHDVSVTSYDFWFARTAAPMWQWICTCGDLGSGFVNEPLARTAGNDHLAKFQMVEMGNGHKSLYDPATGRWRSAGAVAVLGVSGAGWVAFGVLLAVVVAVGLVVLFVAAKRAPTIEEDPPGWVAARHRAGRVVYVKPDPYKLWGAMTTDGMPPTEGDRLLVPGYSWEYHDGRWVRL